MVPRSSFVVLDRQSGAHSNSLPPLGHRQVLGVNWFGGQLECSHLRQRVFLEDLLSPRNGLDSVDIVALLIYHVRAEGTDTGPIAHGCSTTRGTGAAQPFS